MDQTQLQLPYLEIKEVVNRKYLRENFKQTGRASYYIEFGKIKIRDNFNKRVVFEEIPELSESIFVHNLKEPFVLDILPDGTAYIEEGHRRHKAISLLIENNREGWTSETLVEFFSNKNEVTELDRMLNQYTSNNLKKKLKPFEAAEVAYDAKHNFSEKPRSNEEVADLMGISRQQVDNYIAIASASDDLKNQMVMADMNLTDCLSIIKKQKKLVKQAEGAEEESHKNTGAATPFPKDALAGEVKDLEKLEKEPSPEELEIQAEQELAKLLEVSDEIIVKEGFEEMYFANHTGRKLSADVVREWVHDYEENGDPQSRDMSEIIVPKNTILTEDHVKKIIEAGSVNTIFLYKHGMEPIAPSVITEPVAEKEKSKYDEGRPEIKQIQNIIKLADKIEAVVNKLDCPDQTKLDLGNYVKWLQSDAAEVREWVHNNKKQNKRGS